jgi:hypothetical protein
LFAEKSIFFFQKSHSLFNTVSIIVIVFSFFSVMGLKPWSWVAMVMGCKSKMGFQWCDSDKLFERKTFLELKSIFLDELNVSSQEAG